MKLYELDNEYLDFIAAVEDGTIPEDAIEDTLEMLNGDYKDKLDNTICAIKNLTAEAKMIDEEIKALTARKKAKENSVDYLKSCVSRSMQCRGETSFESARNKVAFRKSERLVIADEAAFVENIRSLSHLPRKSARPMSKRRSSPANRLTARTLWKSRTFRLSEVQHG